MSAPRSTSIKVYRGSRRSTQNHVATFTAATDFEKLPEPVKMQRKAQNIETRKNQPAHRFGWEPSAVEQKTLPLILEDGAKTTTTGTYEDVPGVYMIFIKEGNSLRAYPVSSFFKFAAPKVVEADPNAPPAPVVKKELGVQEQIRKRLGLKSEDDDPAAKLSRLRATRESRFAGATEDGDEEGEDFDFDTNFDNDEGVQAPEDVTEDELAPKKMSKKARTDLARMRQAAGEMVDDDADWVHELLYGSDEEEADDEDAEDGDGDDESGKAAANAKKRRREGESDEGRGDAKRRPQVAQNDKTRKDRHAVISTLRSTFQNSASALESSALIGSLRNAIPSFVVGAKQGLSKEESQLRSYWTQILKEVLQEYTTSPTKNKFLWKPGK